MGSNAAEGDNVITPQCSHAEDSRHHVELEEHDVLIADGAAAESYRDDGNRWLFFNTNAGWEGPPREPCAPILTGPTVDAAWRRLLDRAGPRPSVPLTQDPDLNLTVDGVPVDPSSQRGDVVTFRVSHRPTGVRIVSRAATPDTLGLARDSHDLGVAMRRIMVCAWPQADARGGGGRSADRGLPRLRAT